MITQAAQEDCQEILLLAKEHNWTSELFERCKNNDLIAPCIFNMIRMVLSPEEYEQWDDAYCSYFRDQDRELVKWLRVKHKKEERQVEEEKWKSKEMQLLLKKRQLLTQKSQKSTGSLQH